MSAIRVGCQTYTWEMLGPAWKGKVTDILDQVAGAGYAGIEITNTMIGEFAGRPQAFAGELAGRGLELAAFAYAATGFTDRARREEDLAGARKAIEFVRHFPKPRLGLGGAASSSGKRSKELLDQAISFYLEVGRLGADAGVSVNVHPHSHFGSLLETAEEYAYLLDRLDPRWLSFGPDTGHIIRGGQDALACIGKYIGRISHLHLKDVTAEGEWRALGEGTCDFRGILGLLESAGFDGWVVAEEESEDARRDGAAAIRRNRSYLKSAGY
jgi:sugar phosphate isomerase/epimerase